MTQKVYQAIASVMRTLAVEGIRKTRENAQQGYSFRGIDDVYNALSPALAEAGLVIIPRVLSRERVERTTTKGGVLFYVCVEVEFDFVCAEDGSKHTARNFGEAMDSGDKATNKAMSAAYKYAAMQTFCIPTEGDNDPDGTTHVVRPLPPSPPPQPAKRPIDDDKFAVWLTAIKDGKKTADEVRQRFALTKKQDTDLLNLEMAQ